MAARKTAAPKADRPRMQSYGVPASMKGSVPWATAQKRFATAHNYWVTTVHPDGRPNSSAVWGVWLDGKFWFSCSPDARKAKNIRTNPACTITTDAADDAVILEGAAQAVHRRETLRPMTRAYEKKYDWKMNPDADGYFVVTPRVAFAFTEHADRFASSATRYTFAAAPKRSTKRAARKSAPKRR
jgi:hypothetical protein